MRPLNNNSIDLAVEEVDNIIFELTESMSHNNGVLTTEELFALQERIDKVLPVLAGSSYQIDSHTVQILQGSYVDSRIDHSRGTNRSADPLAILVRTTAKLRQLRSEFAEVSGRRKEVGIVAPRQSQPTDNLFLIHGRDLTTRDMVSNFLQTLGVRSIIAMEGPSKGRTIIENMQDAGGASYAVALMTPDDIGSLKGSNRRAMKSRARQNVIYEIGYFTGCLGRDRVCILQAGEIEVPSDLQGTIIISLDNTEQWKPKLARELRAGAFPLSLDEWI
jgi:predicted nucleotide-binding protein